MGSLIFFANNPPSGPELGAVVFKVFQAMGAQESSEQVMATTIGIGSAKQTLLFQSITPLSLRSRAS